MVASRSWPVVEALRPSVNPASRQTSERTLGISASVFGESTDGW
jgi:hypothetical protein